MASSSNSPCAACKFLRRKCTPECVFAPYFPPDSPQKFANVHKVFGASNVSKILSELPPSRREDAVNSLSYEADARLTDPVYGCVGVVSLLQHQLKQLQSDLQVARGELSRYMAAAGIPGPLPASFLQAAAIAAHQQQQYQNQHASIARMESGIHATAASMEHLYREQQLMAESQKMAVAAGMSVRDQHEMIRNYDQDEIMRFNGGGAEQGVAVDVNAAAGGGGLGFHAFGLPIGSPPPSSPPLTHAGFDVFGLATASPPHHQQLQSRRSIMEERRPCSSSSATGGGSIATGTSS